MATYRLIRKIAVGGMAEVFLARVVGAEGFEKPVAVKRVLPSMARDPELVELFLREARLTVCLQHANVVQVFDLGSVSGQCYVVMEFVDGEDLRALQRGAASNQVPLGLREACFIVQQVAEGLAYAHGRADAAGRPLNIIHRDINPSHVMVSSSGEVKLADFGIATAAPACNGTRVGVVKGKVGYLAPEQARGAGVDQRADLFLIGLMLYELLAGRQLFGGTDSFQTLRDISQFDVKRLAPVPGVPPALWSLITRALAPDPTARFQRARDLSDALRSFLFDHRPCVGPRDVAALFARCFPGRHSPLEGSSEEWGEEIRLGPDEGPRRAQTLTSVRSRPPFPGGPRTGRPSLSAMRSLADVGRTQPPPPPPEALDGEAAPPGHAARLHARVVDAALAALGGVGAQGAALARLTRGVARRLGAGLAEAERASAVASALALAAFQQSGERFTRPSRDAVRAILGRDSGELADLIGACTRDAPPPTEGTHRAALALASAVALLEVAGTASPVSSVASRSLVKLRAEGQLPAAALEALSAEVMELLPGDGP